MDRRGFLKSSLAAGFLGAGVLSGVGRRRLSVLLLLTDDQGAHLECLGTRGIRTPVTSGLAADGVLFRNAFSSCASCSPARSTILTGMWPHSNGHWRNTHTPTVPGEDVDYGRDSRYAKIEKVGVHEDIPTLVEVLNGLGYVTGITEKFHLSPVWKYPFAHRLGAGAGPESHGRAAEKFFKACGDRPFFLMANIGNTHRPFSRHIVDIDAPRVDPDAIDVPGNLADTPLMRKDLAEYLDTVQCADACAGAVVESLRASGRYEDTLIIFTSDQGYCYHRAKATAYDAGTRVPMIMCGPGVKRGVQSDRLASHIDLMPTILDLVGAKTPGSVQGLSLRPLLGGGPSGKWRQYVFSEHNAHGPNPLAWYPVRAVFDGRYHYLRNLNHRRKWKGDPAALLEVERLPADVGFAGPADAMPGGPWDNHSFQATVRARDEFPLQYKLLEAIFDRPAEELYDLQEDPVETRNLANDEEYSEVLARLRGQVDAWMEETGDAGNSLRNVPRRTQQ